MKKILIIAGSDSNGGAGLQADLKACAAFGCYGATAVTALTAENTDKIKNIVSLEPNFVADQLEMLTAEFNFDAVKVGMLFNEPIMEAVASYLKNLRVPIVIDPVCVSKMGHKLIKDSAIERLKDMLKLAYVATPNLREAEAIFGGNYRDLPCDIIVKKSVVDGKSIDTLYRKDGTCTKFEAPLAIPEIMHGAGCTFSSSLACLLALGYTLEDAIMRAKDYIYRAITHGIDTNLGEKRLLNHGVKLNFSLNTL